MINELAKYIWPCIIGAIVVTLLIKKSTRKITIKILIGITSTVLALAIIGIIEFYLFKEDMLVIIYPCTLLELIFLYTMIISFKDLSKIFRLHKYGCRTEGIIVGIGGGKGSHYKIRYYVDKREYECIGNRLTDKWKCGAVVTIVYLEDNPQESCLEKEDLNSAIILTVASCLLMIGTIIVECFLLTVI